MKRSEIETKMNNLIGYLNKEVTLKQNSSTIKTQKFKLIGFYELCWGKEIRDASLLPVDVDNLSCSLYAVLSFQETIIKSIDIDIVKKAIDNNSVIDFDFN
jgi:hypothetical protein